MKHEIEYSTRTMNDGTLRPRAIYVPTRIVADGRRWREVKSARHTEKGFGKRVFRRFRLRLAKGIALDAFDTVGISFGLNGRFGDDLVAGVPVFFHTWKHRGMNYSVDVRDVDTRKAIYMDGRLWKSILAAHPMEG